MNAVVAPRPEKFPDRNEYLGSSEISVALGINPYSTPLQLYLEKTGQIPREDLSDRDQIIFGELLEDIVANEFSRRKALPVARVEEELRHPTLPFLRSHIDRRIVGQEVGLECKTAGLRVAARFGEQETDQVPPEYVIQCQAYMATTGWAEWHLAVLIGGQEFRTYLIPRDDELIALIESGAAEFWSRVQRLDPPPVANAEDVKLLYPRDAGKVVAATDEIAFACAELRELKEALKEQEAKKDALELRIKSFMGDNAILNSGGKPLVTWKNNKDGESFDVKAFAAAHPDLHREFLEAKPGARVFLVKK